MLMCTNLRDFSQFITALLFGDQLEWVRRVHHLEGAAAVGHKKIERKSVIKRHAERDTEGLTAYRCLSEKHSADAFVICLAFG